MISTGDKMPRFEALDQDGKLLKSEELIGKKTVIYAYPADMTPGCTAEACSLAESYEKFLAEGYRIVGVSKNSVESHRKFADKYNLPFTLLSDPEHKVMEALGAWGEKKLYGKVSVGTIRKTFIFDEEGICTKVFNKVDTKNHAQQILQD